MTNSFANAAGLMTVVESQPALLMAQADKAFLYIKITLECPGGGSNCPLGLRHASFDCMSKCVESSLNGLFCTFLYVFPTVLDSLSWIFSKCPYRPCRTRSCHSVCSCHSIRSWLVTAFVLASRPCSATFLVCQSSSVMVQTALIATATKRCPVQNGDYRWRSQGWWS